MIVPVPSNFQIMFEVYVLTKTILVCLFPMNILLYDFLNIGYLYNTIEIWETNKVNFFHKI